MGAPELSARKVPCEQCPLRCLAAFRPFADVELEFVKEFKSGELIVQAGTSVLLPDTNSAHLYTVLSGWAFVIKCFPTGAVKS